MVEDTAVLMVDSVQGLNAHQDNDGIKLPPIVEERRHVVVLGRVPLVMLHGDARKVLTRKYEGARGGGGQKITDANGKILCLARCA